jgi:O-antigen ligase
VRRLTAFSRTAARIQQPAVARLGALLLVASIPVLLLHVDYQPKTSLELGSADATLKLSDLAVLALAAAGVGVLAREGVASLRRGAVVLAPAVALLVWIGIGVVVGAVSDRPYATGTHLVTAAGFVEYALIALAVPVLVRSAEALRLVLWALIGWLAVLDVVGLAQLAGWGDSIAGARQPSWIGYHDFAAAGAATLAVGLVAIAVGERWPVGRLREAACITGALGLALSGSVGGALGLVAAAALVVAVAAWLRSLNARRLLAVAAITFATLAGVVALRGGDLAQFARFVGVLDPQKTTSEDVQTYSHRTLLGYFGVRVFADHPVAGAGWQATQEFATLEPYLGDAERRFPDVAAQAFPSPTEPYGVQNAFVQALADLGAIGLALFLAVLAIPIFVGVRVAVRRATMPGPALAGAAVVLACAGAWTAQGLVAGLPLDALTWFGVGLVAAAVSESLTDA